MTKWTRFKHDDAIGFGVLQANTIDVHEGDIFSHAVSTGVKLDLAAVELLTPCEPTKMIGLWNNFHAAAVKQGWTIPEHPLYFIKPSSCLLPSGGTILQPTSYAGRVIYEGELGVVIGKECTNVSEDQADGYIFGYTCVNDVTALALIDEDESFPQWTRAKSFDTFGPFGPVVATGIDPSGLQVQTLLNRRVRQNYPVSDMIFSPRQLVSLISHNMTLVPGDVITCGTSLGALPMKAGATVEVSIEGIGVLSNVFAKRADIPT